MAPSKNTGVNNGGVPARRAGTVNERLAYLFATARAGRAAYSCRRLRAASPRWAAACRRSI
jgi:hypothetical protein